MDRIFEHKAVLGVNAVFDAAKTSTTPERLLKHLFSIYSKSHKATFILEFLQCIATILCHMEKNPAVENVLDFAARYCIYHSSQVKEEEDVLLFAVFEFIFDNHNRKLPAIRFRACEFVNRLLNKMGPQASLDDDVFEKMATTMLERLQDKMPSIRAQAVLALQRLQDPPNNNCKIIKAFLFHMECDPSCDVRTRVVQNIAVTNRTLPMIMGRLQDVKETVRKEVYRTLIRLKPHKFSISQRQAILTSGFADRSDCVKKFVEDHVLRSWFEACSNDLLDFLSILDVVSFKNEILTIILGQLFNKYIPSAELITIIEGLEVESEGKRLIPLNKLSPETSLLWFEVIKHLTFEKCEGVIIPELTSFAKYILRFSSERDLKKCDDQYILIQLIEIACLYSFSDEMGRKQLVETCIDILKDDETGIEVIPQIARTLEILIPNTKERMVIMAELISDIREPLDTVQQNSDIDWEAKEKLEDDTPSSDPVEGLSNELSQLNCESQSLDNCSRDERTDPETIIKCLTIIREMLKAESITKIDATLRSLKEHFIMKCMESEDGRVISLAIDALSLLCIWSVDLAKKHFLQFCILITNDLACVSAIEAVFDMLLIHGFEPFSIGPLSDDGTETGLGKYPGEGCSPEFSKDPSFTPTMKRIVPLLASLLKSSVREVKCKVCEGLTKLLLSSRIDSPIVLSHLIILWFSPSSDREPGIRQPLGIFFSVFSSNRIGAPDIILSAFSPTLRGIEDLHDEDIDMVKVANLFVTLLRPEISSKVGKAHDKGCYHGQLGLVILDEMRKEVIGLPILAKALSCLELDSCELHLSETLLVQAQRTFKWLSKRTNEKRILNVLKKFKDEVEKVRDQHLKKTEEMVEEKDAAAKKANLEGNQKQVQPLEKSSKKRTKVGGKSNSDKDMKLPKKCKVGENCDAETPTISGVERLSSIPEDEKETVETVVMETVASEPDVGKNESPEKCNVDFEVGTSSSSGISKSAPPRRRGLRSSRRK